MILSFSLENFRSIKDLQTLRLDARAIKPKYRYLEENEVPLMKNVSGLKAKAIYGPNAGGKSNLIRGMAVFLNICRKSFADPGVLESVTPFLLSTETEDKPTLFEMEMTHGALIYRFGFVVDTKMFHEEWLFVRIAGKEYRLYERHGQDIDFNKSRFPGGEKLLLVLGKGTSVLRTNALFLAVAASFNYQEALDVYEALSGIEVVGKVMDAPIQMLARSALKNPEMRNAVRELLAQIGIETEEIVYLDEETLPAFGFEMEAKELLKQLPHPQTIGFVHPAYDESGVRVKPILWPVEHGESIGTQKLLWLAPFLVNSIRKGTTLVIDEFEASLHSELSRRIIELYGFNQSNPHHAQLIVATHDTNLLSPQILRRDQIAFVEKDKKGATEIYSLADIKKVRNDESYEKNYLIGKYGALPDTDRLKIAS